MSWIDELKSSEYEKRQTNISFGIMDFIQNKNEVYITLKLDEEDYKNFNTLSEELKSKFVSDCEIFLKNQIEKEVKKQVD